MMTVEKCPYRCKMYWYACHWEKMTAWVFRTKAEAVAKAREVSREVPRTHVVNVGWIENSMGRIRPTDDRLMQLAIWKDCFLHNCVE